MLGYERYLRLILHGWHARRERDLTRKKPMAFFALELFVGWNNKALRVFLSPPPSLEHLSFWLFCVETRSPRSAGRRAADGTDH